MGRFVPSLVEGVEGFCAEFDGGSYMKQVCGSNSDGWRDVFGQGFGAGEDADRHLSPLIHAGFQV
jgi:hypothetical protein